MTRFQILYDTDSVLLRTNALEKGMKPYFLPKWRKHPTEQQLYGHLPHIIKLSKLDEPDMRGMLEN